MSRWYYDKLNIDIKGKKLGDWRIGTSFQYSAHKHKSLWYKDTLITHTGYDNVFYKLPIDNASGNVLLSGLGLGILTNTLAALDKVTAITVVEKYPEVIELISPYITSDKIKIINADILSFVPTQHYDYCFIDIWVPKFNADNRSEEETKLKTNLQEYCDKIEFCQEYEEAWDYYGQNYRSSKAMNEE